MATRCSPTGAGFPHPFTEIDQRSASDVGDLAMSALISAAIRGLGFTQGAALFEQDAEIERGCGIVALVGATVCRLGLVLSAPFLEQHSEI